MKKSLIFFLFFATGFGLFAQPAALPIDRIVAVIGDRVILESDVDNQYNYMVINGQKDDGSLRCRVMEELIVSKLMLNKAEQDSIEISEAQVQGEIDARVNGILEQMGGNQEEFERIYKKPVIQFKEDIREEIREQVLIRNQQQVIINEATITPREVKKFFNGLDKDSLGLLPAEVQLNHIVVTPPWSDESIKSAKTRLRDLRQKIMSKESSFEELAKKYSDDLGSAQGGGSLGEFGRGQMVPKFEEVVFEMRPGDVSDVFETEFGFHIIKCEARIGERVRARHILLKPEPGPKSDSIAMAELTNIREMVLSDSLSFERAAILYSKDRGTKDCGGCITNPQTGELRIPLNALDADLFFKIDEMKPGEISKPMELLKKDGSKAFHIILLKRKIPPHAPNLKDDYKTIHNAALNTKQAEIFDEWLQSAKKISILTSNPPNA